MTIHVVSERWWWGGDLRFRGLGEGGSDLGTCGIP